MKSEIQGTVVGERANFDLKKYAFNLLHIWPFVLLSLFICLCIAWFYLTYKALPQYHINAKLLIEEEGGSGSMIGSPNSNIDFSSIFGAKSSADNEIEVLKTRFLMESLVKDMQLNVKWIAEGTFRDVELFEVPLSVEINNAAITRSKTFFINTMDDSFQLAYDSLGQLISKTYSFNTPLSIDGLPPFTIRKTDSASVPNLQYRLEFSTVEDAAERIRSALTAVLTSKSTTIIDLGLNYRDPLRGELILQSFIDEYIQQNIKDKSRIADSTIAFIDQRILLVNKELNNIEGNIQDFMQSKGLANISAQSELLLENNSEYKKQLATLQTQIEIMNAVEDLLNEPGKSSLISGSVIGGQQSDQGFNNFIMSYNNLVLERDRLLLAYTKDNPYVINVDKRIETVKSNILDYIKNTKASLQTNIASLKKSANVVQGNIRQVPEQERGFLDLSRQQQLKQDLYLFLLQKREEIAVSSTSNIAGIRIIDPARGSKYPFSPKKSIIYTVAFLLGLTIPIGFVFTREALNTKINDRNDVQTKTVIPVISELSHHVGSDDLIPFEASRSASAEQFRGLRTNLQFLMPKQADKVILVTSGMPGEGKSFVSLNLANVYAVSGLKVLLLEFDLRKPKLSKTYGNNKGLGISNFIINTDLNISDITMPVPSSENLTFSACGPIPPNPSELIMNPRTADLFRQAREQFDVIIVDAPPIGAVTDGQLLSEFSDVALYIVRSGYTPKDLVALPEDMRREGKIKNLNIVLNDVKMNKGGNYGSYYGYAYGYYGQEEKQKKWWKRKK